MTDAEAAEIVAELKTANPLWETLAPEARKDELTDYLVSEKGLDALSATLQAGRILRAGQPATRTWATEKTEADDADPLALAVEKPKRVPPSPAAEAVERIEGGRRRINPGDGRLRNGVEIPELIETWIGAANLSDAEAATVLGFSERMTIYNMRKNKQRAVLTDTEHAVIRADVESRIAALKGVLTLMEEYT